MAKRKRGGRRCLTRVNKAVLLLSAALPLNGTGRFGWWTAGLAGGWTVREKRKLPGFSARSGSWSGSWIRGVKSCATFFSGIDVKILSVYRRFLEQADCYLPQELAASVRRHTLAPLRKRKVAQEDLARADLPENTDFRCGGLCPLPPCSGG